MKMDGYVCAWVQEGGEGEVKKEKETGLSFHESFCR
jgi:hypothetical protein